MTAVLLALLLASPALEAARQSLADGKTDAVLFALEPSAAVPKEEAKDAAALLTDAGKLADARGDKPMALLLVQTGLKKEPAFAPALQVLSEWSLRDNEYNLAIRYAKEWVSAEPANEKAKELLARTEAAEREWTPPEQPQQHKSKKRRHARAAAKAPQPEARDAQITLFGNAACRDCKAAREWMTAHGLAWAEVDVDKDERGARELSQKKTRFRLHGKELPVIEVNGVLIEGFNPRGIDAALARQ